MSDPVVIHPELAPETHSTLTSDAFHKRRRFHNPPGSPQATGNFRDFWGYVFRQAFRRLPTEWPRHHAVPPEIAKQQLESSGTRSNTSLWAAFLFEYQGFKLYFGGDSAMGPVFRQTGHKYGPIDLALIGIGAYSPRKLLRSVHASPEEAVEMAKAIGAKAILGMHWGTIELSEEEAFEPARRFTDAASREGYAENDIWLPSIGETIALDVVEVECELKATGT